MLTIDQDEDSEQQLDDEEPHLVITNGQ